MALQHYSAAMDILFAQLKGKERAMESPSSKNDEQETKTTIVRALIGQVEIWMDPAYDLWSVIYSEQDRPTKVFIVAQF